MVKVVDRQAKVFITEKDGGSESSSFTGEYTKRVDHRVELHIDAEASQLDEVFIDGELLLLGVDYLVTGNTIITYLSGFLDSLATGAYEAEVTFSNGFIEQGVLVIKELSPTPPSGGSSNGGGSLKKDDCPDGDFSPSYYDGTCGISPEFPKNPERLLETDETREHGTAEEKSESQVYLWAREYHLTSMETYEDFRPYDAITRAEMAKIVVLYTKMITPNFLASEESIDCAFFTDLAQVNAELQAYITQSCELGLMGYYSDGETQKDAFSPNDRITRAEVATILSRMLR